jgi:UPF0176 protein
MSIANIAGYKFVALSAPYALRDALKPLCVARQLKGTILLSSEGINVFVAGAPIDVDALIAHLHEHSDLRDMTFTRSVSRAVPFKRMLIKVKREIIPGNGAQAPPAAAACERATVQALPSAPRLSAMQLKRWLDEGRALTLLDARNAFEVALGTFRGAQHLDLHNFREFAGKSRHLDAHARQGPIVTFCTGGIRCEKAAPILLAQGFREVYQLDGGILEYFRQCGGAHYEGNCFVFDERVALTPQLEEAGA